MMVADKCSSTCLLTSHTHQASLRCAFVPRHVHSLCVMTGVWIRHVTAPLCLYEQLGAEQCNSSEYVTMTRCVCIAHYKQTKLVVVSRMLWFHACCGETVSCNTPCCATYAHPFCWLAIGLHGRLQLKWVSLTLCFNSNSCTLDSLLHVLWPGQGRSWQLLLSWVAVMSYSCLAGTSPIQPCLSLITVSSHILRSYIPQLKQAATVPDVVKLLCRDCRWVLTYLQPHTLK